jgi:hypothetical protein
LHDDAGLGTAAERMRLREVTARGVPLASGNLVAGGSAALLLRLARPKDDPRGYVASQKSTILGLDSWARLRIRSERPRAVGGP